MTTARAVLDDRMSEKDFQQLVVDLATVRRWSVYHTFDSRHSAAGFPDLVLIRPPRLVFVELKREAGTPTLPQQAWQKALAQVADLNDTVEVHLWRPSDWPSIQELLW